MITSKIQVIKIQKHAIKATCERKISEDEALNFGVKMARGSDTFLIKLDDKIIYDYNDAVKRIKEAIE